MEEAKSSSRYSLGPPWTFKGRSLYQIHLVKADMVRALVPKNFRLVEAFGYTLGGMFLAHYEDSPAGAFDELVTIAGIVWNPPTSCAWASRVLVSSHEACEHGRKDVGLPSHYASFSKRIDVIETAPEVKNRSFLNFLGLDHKNGKQKCMKIEIMDTVSFSAAAFCNISIPLTGSETDKNWMGPHIRMSLPSFSGNTDHNPHLIKYSCKLSCSIRAVKPARITAADSLKMTCGHESQIDHENNSSSASTESSSPNAQPDSLTESEKRHRSISVLLSKPILALEFNHMIMQVDAPRIIIHQPGKMT